MEPYDQINRGWIDILMKLASWRHRRPHGRDAHAGAADVLHDSSDVERLRKFVFESSFLQRYEIPEEAVEVVRTSDEALICLGLESMKSVLFQSPSRSGRRCCRRRL